MTAFIKIVCVWKLDNKPSYLRASAAGFDNSQHLQINVNKDTPTRWPGFKNATAAGEQLGAVTSWALSKKQNKQNKEIILHPPQQNSKIFLS